MALHGSTLISAEEAFHGTESGPPRLAGAESCARGGGAVFPSRRARSQPQREPRPRQRNQPVRLPA